MNLAGKIDWICYIKFNAIAWNQKQERENPYIRYATNTSAKLSYKYNLENNRNDIKKRKTNFVIKYWIGCVTIFFFWK